MKPEGSAQNPLPKLALGTNYSSRISATMVRSHPQQQPKELLAQAMEVSRLEPGEVIEPGEVSPSTLELRVRVRNVLGFLLQPQGTQDQPYQCSGVNLDQAVRPPRPDLGIGYQFPEDQRDQTERGDRQQAQGTSGGSRPIKEEEK